MISSIKNTKYEEKFEIIAGELVYAGNSEKESNWCDRIIESKEFKIDVSVIPDANDLVVNIKLTGALVKESNVEWYKVYIKKTSEEYRNIPDKEITEKSLSVSTILNENIETDTEYIVKVEVKMLNESEARIKESEKFVTNLDEPIIDGSWNQEKGVNKPELSSGMVPVKYYNGNWIICSVEDPEWYDYINQASGIDGTSKWANIMLMDDLRTTDYTNIQIKAMDRQEINTTLVGQTVTNFGSMYVWIPRYAYAITSGYHLSSTGVIKIAFLEGTKTYNVGDSISYKYQVEEGTVQLTNASGQGNWNEHPAFNFDGIKSGIWVGKFESSKSNEMVKVIPNVTSWTGINASTMFTNSRNISTTNYAIYGFEKSEEVNTHMMKNTEWGCAAYLAHSSYGRNKKEVQVNTHSGLMTGGGNYVSNIAQSTTGNITGIYDMSGGTTEYVMGIYRNTKYSGFSSLPETKYYNNYQDYSEEIYGDAVFETPGWNGDTNSFVNSNTPFFTRGGYRDHTTGAGLFCYYVVNESWPIFGFRVALLL